MDSDLKNEDKLLRIRSKLNSDQVKLWQAPYFDENVGSNNKEIETLAVRYGSELQLPESEVMSALIDLQNHSIQRAKANSDFKETGVALLRLRVPPQQDGSKFINLQIKLVVLGCELINAVANKLAIDSIRVKLIHQGRIVKKDTTLQQQGIKNGAQILVVLLTESPEKLHKDADLYMLMQTARSDAELLSENADNDFGHYMQLEDQSGNRLELPASERKALTVAMTLHERGRKEIKQDNYPLALVLLLEADKQFSECNAKILQSVDNYALLNLDICWCYLCLQSITHVPDAEARLTACEGNFHRSYGHNLERLIALKGSCGNEQALLMRLHLLQAIVLYHQNRRPESKSLLQKAETEFQSLKVDSDALCSLLELGCTAAEARMGLRARQNKAEEAYAFILSKREERIQSRKRAKEEQESRALGKCIDGKQYISMTYVKILEEMGYPKKTAILALKNSNNHVSNAVQIILEEPHMLKEEDLPRSLSSHSDIIVDEEALKKLLDLGFDRDMVKMALKNNENQLNKAAEYLMDTFQGFIGGAGTSSSVGSGFMTVDSNQNKEKTDEKRKMETEVKAAFERLSEGLDIKDDDYLDLTLNQEEEFLRQYKDLL